MSVKEYGLDNTTDLIDLAENDSKNSESIREYTSEKKVKRLFSFVPFSMLLLTFVIFGLLLNSFLGARLYIAVISITLLFVSYAAVVALYVFDKKPLYRAGISLFGLLFTIAIIHKILHAIGILEKFTSIYTLKEYINSLGTAGQVIFVSLQFLQVVILPVPSFITTMAGAALFGTLRGFFLSFIGIMIGSIFAFSIGKIFGARLVGWIIGEEALEKYREKMEGRDKVILSAMFLLPVFPDDMLCMIAGLSSFNYRQFIIMLILTRPLGILMTVFVGNSLISIPFAGPFLLIWLAMLTALVTAFILLWKYNNQIINFIANIADRFKRSNNSKVSDEATSNK
ncbi:MAG: TVP38/TMEM64 family protein [Firmicutes bacterium]|nr:TVP38/TMEM64 family protein [Bacillota bacterium]MCL2177666.1 TVP38/TMEM64 family protein [Bacillota bacterium]